MKTLWFIGLPFSGKTTLACSLKERMAFAHVVDDSLVQSHGLNFSPDNINDLKSIAFTCHQLNDNGVFVVNSLFMPIDGYPEVEKILGPDLITVYLDSPKTILSRRMWNKGSKEKSELYMRHAGSWKKPKSVNLHVDTSDSVENCTRDISSFLSSMNNFA